MAKTLAMKRYLVLVIIGTPFLVASGAESPSDAAAKPSVDTEIPTERLNKAIPKWLRFRGEERIRWEGFGGGGFTSGNDDFYLLNRIRFDMALLPASWLKFDFQV